MTTLELLISVIIILAALIYIEVVLKKSDPEDIDIKKELKENWDGTFEDFIDFKKFQYSRAFSSISEATPYIVFPLTLILIGLKDIIIQLAGLTIYASLIIAVTYIFFRLILHLATANKNATENMRYLLNNKMELSQLTGKSIKQKF